MKKVSCICNTYDRVARDIGMLEEAVESFLIQTYQNKELIILNDHSRHKIVFDHPQVRVINTSRLPSLGEKHNYAVNEASGELICNWDDDDISLAHRIEYSVNKIKDYDYYNPQGYFTLHNGQTNLGFPPNGAGYAHNCSIFTKRAFKLVGEYPHTSFGEDAAMFALLSNTNSLLDPISYNDSFYIYKWGFSKFHISGQSIKTDNTYLDRDKIHTLEGTFYLDPHWNIDYNLLVKNFIEGNNDNNIST